MSPVDREAPDAAWMVLEADGSCPSWERAGIAVLMDIRRELKRLNSLLSCPNFTGIPSTLTQIKRNTAKPKRKAKGAKR